MMAPEDVDGYLREGCGRCEHHRTPRCKVHRWVPALEALRAIVRDRGLIETIKWGAPCYTLDGENVLLLAALRDACVLSFLEGAALTDDTGLLVPAGPNSRIARQVVFRSLEEVVERRAAITALVEQAIALARVGVKAPRDHAPGPMPEELARRLAADPELAEAFEALTPGRRRSHVLQIAAAKQATTRERRVERAVPMIRAGRGFEER